MPGSLLSPREAAVMLGVSESTVRRWCDGGFLPVTKTKGRHRRIERADLMAFARQEGLALTSVAAWPARAKPGKRKAASTKPQPAHAHAAPDNAENPSPGEYDLAWAAPVPVGDGLNQHREALLAALMAGDESTVHRLIIELTTSAAGPAELCDDVIAPVMHRIGVAWAQGQLAIHHEHWATQAVHAGLSAARVHLPVPEPAGPIIPCAALSGDPYTLGPSMSALVLKAEGYRPRLLGSDTPLDEILRAARTNAAPMVAISIAIIPDPAVFAAAFAQFAAAAARDRIGIIVGGRGLTRSVRARITADFFGDTMTHLCGYLRRHKAASGAASE